MKTRFKLSALILMISIGCSVYSQTSELIVEPTRATKKACVCTNSFDLSVIFFNSKN